MAEKLKAVRKDDWTPAYSGPKGGAGGACKLVNSGNYKGSIGTIAKNDDWRVDRQNPTQDGDINIQIQKNGVQNPSTIGCVLVPGGLSAQVGSIYGGGPKAKAKAKARSAELTRVIHSGLTQSVGSRQADAAHPGKQQIMVFKVIGSFSS